MKIIDIEYKETWEKYIDAHTSSALFQRWDWGEVQKENNLQVFRFGYEEQGKYIAIAQVVVVIAKRGNFLHVRHGPVLSTWNKETLEKVIIHLRTIAKKHHCVCIRMSPCIEPTKANNELFISFGALPAAIHAMDAEYAWALDITPNDDMLLSGMRKTTRYEIRRAEKMGIVIKKEKNISAIDAFLSLYKETSKRQGFHSHVGIKEEFSIFSKNNNAICITGYYEGQPIASAIIIFSGSQAIYHHGASIPSKIPVSYLVQWEAIKEAKRRGYNIYNFWGIAPTDKKNHPWQGLTLFKKGFGGYELTMLHAYDVPLDWRYWIFRAIEWVRKQYKGY